MQELQATNQVGTFRRINRDELRARVRKMRFWEYFLFFIQNEKVGKIRPVTLKKYDLALKYIKEIAPEMLLIDLEENRKNMQWLLDQYGATRQKKTVLGFKWAVMQSLNFAVEDGYIKGFAKHGIELNSIEKTWTIEQRSEKKNKIMTFDLTQFRKFKSYIDFKLDEELDEEPHYQKCKEFNIKGRISDQAYYMIFMVAIHTGARFSEIIGFKYEDVSNKGLFINKTWNYKERGNESYTLTKNESSIRTVVIDDTMHGLVDRYWAFKKRYGLHVSGHPLLVENNAPIYNSTVNDKLYSLEKKLRLPKISIHKLRHTYVSVLIDRGISESVIAKQVGHSSLDMIHRVYGHLLKGREERETLEIKGLMG